MEIDPDRLRLLADIDSAAGRALVAQLLRAYAGDTRASLVELRERAEAGDRTAVRRLAHRMKGSSAMIGAGGLADLFARVETAAADPSGDTREPIASAERSFGAAVVEIAAWLGGAV